MCQTIDYRSRFGPVRDQDGQGYCWAFVSAALMEENLCRRAPAHCRRSLSPLDAARCDWKLGQEREGDHHFNSLLCATRDNEGVCSEANAPYDSLSSLGCTIRAFFLNDNPACNNSKLMGLYREWRRAQTDCGCNNQHPANSASVRELAQVQTALVRRLIATMPDQALAGKNVRQLFTQSRNGSDFLERVLIPVRCERNRYRITGTPNVEDVSNQQQAFRSIRNALMAGTSVGVGVQLSRTSLGRTGSHGIVINGMRFNTQTNQCELSLRNSWGAGAPLHGWTPINDIIRGVEDVTYIR